MTAEEIAKADDDDLLCRQFDLAREVDAIRAELARRDDRDDTTRDVRALAAYTGPR